MCARGVRWECGAPDPRVPRYTKSYLGTAVLLVVAVVAILVGVPLWLAERAGVFRSN